MAYAALRAAAARTFCATSRHEIGEEPAVRIGGWEMRQPLAPMLFAVALPGIPASIRFPVDAEVYVR